MKKNLSEQLANNLNYYVNNPNKRCANEMGMCYYSGKTAGKNTVGCFVGRLMKPKDRIKADEYAFGSVSSLIKDAPSHGIKLPKIIINNLAVMNVFQKMHDGGENWNEKGLSVDGKSELRYIISKHDLDAKYFDKFLVD